MKNTLLAATILALLSAACQAQDASPPAVAEQTAPWPVQVRDEQDQAILASFRDHARAFSAKLTAQHFQSREEPEMLCWQELKHMDMSLTAYELTGDQTHLQDFVAALANLRSALKKSPDGFLGWRGKPIKPLRNSEMPDVEIDEIQAEFRAVAVLARFLEIVGRDVRLQKQYADLRAPLIDLMENHLVKKWTIRGYWTDLGTAGGTYRNHIVYPGKPGISLPWEKLAIMLEGLLNLHRATGNDEHLQKAVKIGTWMKRCLQLQDERYLWYNWSPVGRWDIHLENPNRWKSWIGRSPIGGWYDAEVSIPVMLYHHGLVFDRRDMERLLKTQMEVCWNGSIEEPKFVNVEGKESDRPNQQFLSTWLAPFSDKLSTFVFTGLQQQRLEKRANDWHGGVLAGPYLWHKYILMPAAKDGKAAYVDVGKRFLASPENQKFVKDHAFEVTGQGYKMPMTPQQMDPMPEAPDPKGGFRVKPEASE